MSQAGSRGQSGVEHRLAGHVEVTGQLEHGASRHFAQALAFEVVAGHQAIQGRGQHVDVGGLRVGAVGAGEGNAVATDDGARDEGGHDRYSWVFLQGSTLA